MKKLFVILSVVLMNVFNVVATPIDNLKINREVMAYVIGSNDELENLNDSIIKYDNMNFTPVYNFLQISNEQYEEFYRIHKNINKSLNYLSEKKEKGVKAFNNHVKADLKNSSYILNDEQYHKYIRLINIALVNRGLSQYLLQYN